MVFDGYGVEQKHCDSLLESTKYMLRSFKYRVPQKDENNLGLHAHTDTSFFTILHQNNVNGLQVKLKNGEWIDVDPSPFMFLILAGDAFKVGHFSHLPKLNPCFSHKWDKFISKWKWISLKKVINHNLSCVNSIWLQLLRSHDNFNLLWLQKSCEVYTT